MKKLTKKDQDFLALCEFWALKKSKDPSTQVAAVITRPNNTIASLAYNGFPQRIMDDTYFLKNREEKYKRILHAENNAMIFCKEDMKGYTLYTWPLPPCSSCALNIIQAGIKKVVSIHPSDNRWKRWKESCELANQLFKEACVDYIWKERHEI